MNERKPGYSLVDDGADVYMVKNVDAPTKDLQEIDERRIERPADPERVWYDHEPKGVKQ